MMSKIEITLRLENDRMAAVILKLSTEIAAAQVSKYGEQCDDTPEEPPAKLAAFPARALKYQVQRIGLFTPGPIV